MILKPYSTSAILLALVFFNYLSCFSQDNNLPVKFQNVQKAIIVADTTIGQINFGVNDLRESLQHKGYKVTIQKDDKSTSNNICFVFAQKRAKNAKRFSQDINSFLTKDESFIIRSDKGKKYYAIGSDITGVMYAGLELAENIRLYGVSGIKETEQKPFIEKRGLKFNIPLDARTPSYGDAGDAAQKNIITLWELDFWKAFIDDLARYRYNTLSLWNDHPFPSIVKMADYPDVALNDVMKTTIPVAELHGNYETNSRRAVTNEILANLETIKSISIDDKIKFWQEVMQYGADRGIKFYWFTWNTFVWGAEGKYGITADLKNEETKNYYRKCISETFTTYPLLAGIGITAGENMLGTDAKGKEQWLYDVYAEGMNDAIAMLPPDRNIRLIHRGHQADVPSIVKQFDGFKGQFDFSLKYAGDHIYANTDPTYVDGDFEKLPADKRAWVELRNDDIFNFRWGDPDFTRTFIKTLPGPDKLTGYLMGSDGYVWAREHTSTEPENPRELEIEKHWYNFMLWGRLGYNPDLSNQFFQSVINKRFPQVDAVALFDAWILASKVFPRITEFYWYRRDLEWAVEGCLSRKGWGNKGDFHTVRDFAYGPNPEGGNGDMIKIDTYVKNVESGQPNNGTTPLELADEIQGYADAAIKKIDQIGSMEDKTLRLTLGDIRCMALLGRYYADKLRGAVELRFYDANNKTGHRQASVAYMVSAANHWRQLADLASSQYNPQYLARNNYIDWKGLITKVLEDIDIAKRE
jgi:hypothetical protein